MCGRVLEVGVCCLEDGNFKSASRFLLLEGGPDEIGLHCIANKSAKLPRSIDIKTYQNAIKAGVGVLLFNQYLPHPPTRQAIQNPGARRTGQIAKFSLVQWSIV